MSTIRRLADAEIGMIHPLFERIFTAPISPAMLRWKYGDGRGESWAALSPAGELLLHCGVVFRNILLRGEPARAAQLVDLMATPKSAGLSRRKSPFAQLMRAVLAELPRRNNPAGIAFGFPSGRSMQLGEHLGVYRSVGKIASLTFSPAPGRARFEVLPALNARERQAADLLWQRMAADFAGHAIGVRDAAYLEQRYFRHPEKRYVVLMARSRLLARPAGLAVIRPDQGQPELLDIIAPRQAFGAVIAACRRWLSMQDAPSLEFLLPETFSRELAPLAASCNDTQFRIMANPFSPPETLQSLDGRWWLTGGDTDYR